MREYELVMVLSPQVDEEGVTRIVDRVTQFVTQRGGSITNQQHWGTRQLAYPIDEFREGNYVMTGLAFDPSSAKELEADIKSSAEVIRYLLVKKDPKALTNSKTEA